jgi:hypothetical protein
MKLLDVPIGLLINFNEIRVIDGIHRLILPSANKKLQDINTDDSEMNLKSD